MVAVSTCGRRLSGWKPARSRGAWLGTAILVGTVASVLAAPPVAAQTAPLEDRDFDVPAGALDAALARFGNQADLRIDVPGGLAQGRQTNGVRARLSVDAALRELLAGSGLTFRYTGSRTVVIEAVPDAEGAMVLGAVRVGGSGGGAAVSGVNGSSDPTATEDTGSYTTGAMTIASKTPQAIKDTPVSVSVITRQRIEDQNLTDLSQALGAATGISAITGSRGALEPEFYSRGFRVQRMQIDGGAPIDIQNSNYGMSPQFDMALYDHVEILRGADGQYNAYGNPGGVISLTRKRPLDRFQVLTEAQVGSWNTYRASVDVTGPLAFDGHLRGRGVVVWQDQEFFYDVARNNQWIRYGALEYDLGPKTVLGGCISRTWQKAVPFTGGLPRFSTGADLCLPRSTSLSFPWGRYRYDQFEAFGWLEHKFSDTWNGRFNATYIKQDRDTATGNVSGPVNSVTFAGPLLTQVR